jgi:ribosomal protein L12E/L44/L45/RPP1/RPP2
VPFVLSLSKGLQGFDKLSPNGLTLTFGATTMSNSSPPDFSKFVPGFDFLQSLTQGKSNPLPGPAAWVAPTLDPKELDKRIEELKAVQFWLDQNATALKATIQALEVQKMTLATLQGMNLDMNAMSKAFQFPSAAPATPASPTPKAPPKPETPPAAEPGPAKKPFADAFKASTAPAVDPVQLWTSLTQQFQQIASSAMQEVAKQANVQASKASPPAAKSGASRASAKKTAAKKSAKKPDSR